MRSFLLIAALLVAGVTSIALEKGQECVPNSTFNMECNRCRCSSDGKLLSCTRKFCALEEMSDDPKVTSSVADEEATTGNNGIAEKEEEQVHTNGQVCTPNEVKMEDCNRCKCANNGIGWFCTRKACPPKAKRQISQQQVQKCVPGTKFKAADGCNECTCTETGQAACTLMACFNRKRRETPDNKQECVPGTRFQSDDGCNSCFCTKNGLAACTEMACIEPKPVKQECTPGTTFKSVDGCNDCTCTETGHALCTLRACLRKRRDSPNPESKCVPGTSFKSSDGCNNCFCTDNGMAACTQKYCFPKLKRDTVEKELPVTKVAPYDPSFTCEPGTAFKFECNTCRCSSDGKTAGCTYKFCLPGEY